MTARIGVVTFPGSLDDKDALRAVEAVGNIPVPLWHADATLQNVDAVILPGGFSYGDYLRCGAIAKFAPIMKEIASGASQGLPVLGICNGFQILCEAGLLPGVLTRNAHMHFRCRDQWLSVESTDTLWTSAYEKDQRVQIPIKHAEGRFVADTKTLDMLEAEGRIVLRYADENPNGASASIAGVANATGNVVGVMPHPEHAIDQLTGPSSDGLGFFTSLLKIDAEQTAAVAG